MAFYNPTTAKMVEFIREVGIEVIEKPFNEEFCRSGMLFMPDNSKFQYDDGFRGWSLIFGC